MPKTLRCFNQGVGITRNFGTQITLLETICYLGFSHYSFQKALPQAVKGVTGAFGVDVWFTLMLETGTIDRFAGAGNFASYCRCVDSKRTSNGKKKGEGNAKAGNKYLSRAFSEAAHFSVRFEPLAQRFYERKKAKTNGIIAIRAVARKLARASWMMLKHQVPYDARRMFPG